MKKNTKEELRKYFKQARFLLPIEQEQEYNDLLLVQFQQFDWEGLSYVHVFIPIEKFKEPNSLLFVNWLRSMYPSIHIVISKSDLKTNMMDHYLWEKEHLLEINKWGIQEPQGGKAILAHQLDAVIIPLLAFDKSGHRIGYGKGFYDRFLSACRPDCLKIGLSFYDPVDKIEDINQTDIPLDYCITPHKIWSF